MKKFLLVVAMVALLIVPSMSISAQDPISLTLWHAKENAEGDALLALIEAFVNANPDYTIEQVYNPSGTLQDSFETQAGAGEGPDMVVWANDAVGPWSQGGFIVDLTDMITDDLRGQAVDAAWTMTSLGESVYAIPYSGKTLALYYNKALVPDAPTTWAEVLEISEELAGDGITGLAFQNGFFHSAGFLYALGGSLMDENGDAAFAPGSEGADAMTAYLQFHADMYALAQDADSGVVIDGSSPVPGFQTGEVGMVYDGNWALAQYEADLGDDLGIAIMPALDNGNVPALFAQIGDAYYANAAIADDTDKMAAFMAWANFLLSAEGQAIAASAFGLIPVNPETMIENPNVAVFAEQYALGTPFPTRPELGAFWGPMGDAIGAVGAGGEAPADVAARAYEQIQAAIDEIQGS
jgi:maltose-binding protein MalE